MPCDAPVMTATFLSLLMLVSFILPPQSPWPRKIILDARDAGLGAGLILVAAGRSPDAERSDNFVSDLDCDRARKQCNVGQRPERWTGRIFGGERRKGARSLELEDRPESHDCVCLAEGRRRGADGRVIAFGLELPDSRGVNDNGGNGITVACAGR